MIHLINPKHDHLEFSMVGTSNDVFRIKLTTKEKDALQTMNEEQLSDWILEHGNRAGLHSTEVQGYTPPADITFIEA